MAMQLQQQTIALDRAASERRTGQDRRRHNWRTIAYGLSGRGRRRLARRHDHSYYLDWYEPKLVFTGIAILLMSSLDALLTLTLMEQGAYEANYFMARLLDTSQGIFITTKIGVTAAAVLFLLMHAHFRLLRITRARRLLQLLVLVYGVLIAYEVLLLGVLR
ncbi:MAG TPA: hypothetical protein ENK05_00805 [Gammaproteobacteria bacterium]|nr:hypothetical protein [Gammaproteobacteria bacterium]